MSTMAGVGYVEIRPDTSNFQAALDANVSSSLQGVQSKSGNVKVTADTKDAQQAIEGLQGAFDKLKGYAALVLGGLGLAEGVNLVKDAYNSAADAALASARNKDIFGPANNQLQNFITSTHAGLFQTTGDMESAAAKMGTALRMSLPANLAEPIAEHMLSTASKIAALNPGADLASITGAMTMAVQTGTAPRGLAQYGLKIDQATLTEQALSMGFLKPDTSAQASAAAKVLTAQDKLNKLQTGTADPQKVKDAQEAAALAQNKAAAALKLHGDKWDGYRSAALAAQKAEEAVTAAQEAGKGTQVEITQAKADYEAAVAAAGDKVDALTSKYGTLTEAQKAQTIDAAISAAAGTPGGVNTQFADPEVQAALDRNKATETWHQALEDVGNKIMPTINSGLLTVSGWFETHQTDIDNFGKNLATGLGVVKSGVQFVMDHVGTFELIGGILLGWKVGSELLGVVNTLGKLSGLGVLGGGSTGVASVVTQRGSSPMNPVFVSVVGSVGGGGVPPVVGAGGLAGASGIGAAIATGFGAALLAAGFFLPLNMLIQKLTNNYAFDPTKPSDWGSLNNPLSSYKGGGDDLLEQFGAAEQHKLQDWQTAQYFGGDAVGSAAHMKEIQDDFLGNLGSTAMQKVASGGAANAGEVQGAADWLKGQGFSADSGVVKEYSELADLMRQGKVQSGDDLTRFLNTWDSINDQGMSVEVSERELAAAIDAARAKVETATANIVPVSGYGDNPIGVGPYVRAIGPRGARSAGDRGAYDSPGAAAADNSSDLERPVGDRMQSERATTSDLPAGLSAAIAGAVSGLGNVTNNTTINAPVTVASSDIDVVTAINRALHLATNAARGVSPALGANWPDTLRQRAGAGQYAEVGLDR